MTPWTLIRRSLRFRARAHLGVVLGAVVGSAALIGALVVGDSVRESLRERALERLGNVHYALAPAHRLFRAQLAGDLKTEHQRLVQSTNEGQFAAALLLSASAVNADASGRANRVQLIGVDHRFAEVGGARWTGGIAPGHVVLNQPLASQLRVRPGDTVLLRAARYSTLSRETPLAPQADASFALRLRVSEVVPTGELGNFSLSASQAPALNAFVDLALLQQQAGASNRANLLLVGPILDDQSRRISAAEAAVRNVVAEISGKPSRVGSQSSGRKHVYLLYSDKRVARLAHPAVFSRQLRSVWKLEDAELEVREVPGARAVELRSSRIFLEPAARQAVRPLPESINKPGADRRILNNPQWRWLADPQLAPVLSNYTAVVVSNAQPLLTYLVNQFRAGNATTPYSMITAAGAPWVPADLKDDEILINQWLADDLQIGPGAELSITYFDPESGAHLVERTNRFRVRAVLPLAGIYADPTLMPEFPGLAKAESTHDWDAGFPLVHTIREKDEAYWKQYRGTPKAFVTLAAGQKMWANRFGNLTAIRFPVPTNAAPQEFRQVIERSFLANLQPEALGLRFEPVRTQALAAASQGQDFGQLFLGFSFFLIVAALILMALLFQFGLEQRAGEVGTLLALGFTPKQVRRLLWTEGTLLALLGGIAGVFGGLAYARGLLLGLTTMWRNAVGTSALSFHATPGSIAIGLAASLIVSALTIALVLRRQARQPARELLAEGAESQFSDVAFLRRSRGPWFGAAALIGALGTIGWALVRQDTAAAGAFFGAGTLLLAAGLAFASAWLWALARSEAASRLSVSALGVRGATRRRKRSLAVAGLLACGTFLIVAIGAFKLDADQNAWRRSSGTGGFALIGESTLPVLRDVNSPGGREFYALDEAALVGVSFVPMRVHDGDDASCLNLNRAQKPRLLGVKPELLAQRGAFAFAQVAKGASSQKGWELLRQGSESRLQAAATPEPSRSKDSKKPPEGGTPNEIPAIGDQNSILWALGKKVGDTLDFVDEHGQPFKVRIVGAVANSILQGSLLISEADFLARFPSESGYRMFLIDAPSNSVAAVAATLTRALQDVGLELTPAAQRLAAFNAVQNTYLNTFQVLGGIGLLLGSAGLGVVVLRNVLERRGELALLQAVGFRRRALQWLVLSEHAALLALGLGIGVVAALVAIFPALRAPGTDLPLGSLALTVAAVLASGMVWTWAATWVALRGKLLEALRSE